MITDWSSMFPADSDEYWPELQQAIDHWERRISDDPGMFNQLVWGLMVATHRAEAAETLLEGMQQAIIDYDVTLRRSGDTDFAVEIIGVHLGNLAVLGFGVNSTITAALAEALLQISARR